MGYDFTHDNGSAFPHCYGLGFHSWPKLRLSLVAKAPAFIYACSSGFHSRLWLRLSLIAMALAFT